MTASYLKRPKTNDEFGRQRALDELHILDTPKEEEFERITTLVKSIFGSPVVAVTLIDRHRQWFKSLQGLEVEETSRDVAFCDHTIREDRCLKVEDATQDVRFKDNPVVTGEPYIRAYLGAPLVTSDGYLLGALCVIDFAPRQFSTQDENILSSFADMVVSEMELRRVASVDELTRLSNRRVFNDSLSHIIAEGGEEPGALIIFDIDHFKKINDAFGHSAGDFVLQAVASIMKRTQPTDSVSCRSGGEEFAVVLSSDAGIDALDLAEKLRASIESANLVEIDGRQITASFGVARLRQHQSRQDLIDAADAALYQAKKAGRNTIVSA